MRLVVVSDTHARVERMEAILPTVRAMRPDALLHLGDHLVDADWFAKRLDAPVEAVRGNCDGFAFGGAGDIEKLLEWAGHRIYLCHGHTLDVKMGQSRLLARAKAMNADVALFGHTHKPYVACVDGVLLLNPGSVGFGWDGVGHQGIGFLELEEGQPPQGDIL